MTGKYHINPRFRAYGKARLDVTLRAMDENERQEMWREPYNPFPFSWGRGWNHSFEYKVEDFAAEVGFFIDILGFEVRAFSPRYAQFISPEGGMCFSVVAVDEEEETTPPDTIRLQLNLVGAKKTVKDLENRGIIFNKALNGIQDDISKMVGYFRSPHGVRIEIWNETQTVIDEESEIDVDILNDDETDRLIDELLGLSDEDSDLDQEEAGVLNQDVYPDTINNQETEVDKSITEETEQSSLFVEEEQAVDRAKKGIDQSDRPSPEIETSSSRPESGVTQSSSNWPSRDNRLNGELTYDEIEDEFPYSAN